MNAGTGAPFRIVPGGLELVLRVTPRGGSDALDGVGVDAAGRCFWQVRVRFAPEGGAANRAVIALVAGLLDVPARDIRVVAGEMARIKRLKIVGNAPELVVQALSAAYSLTRRA